MVFYALLLRIYYFFLSFMKFAPFTLSTVCVSTQARVIRNLVIKCIKVVYINEAVGEIYQFSKFCAFFGKLQTMPIFKSDLESTVSLAIDLSSFTH